MLRQLTDLNFELIKIMKFLFAIRELRTMLHPPADLHSKPSQASRWFFLREELTTLK